MKLYLLVLIAAVTVNCLVTAINGETSSDTLAVPYTDMLLPPFEHEAESSEADSNVKDKVKTVSTKPTTITTTKKPITNDADNNLPELSIEALLPPLFEARIKEDETKETTIKKTTTTTTTTTTKRPTTTRAATTRAPTTTTTTLQATKIEVPDLLLEPFLPPLLDNEILTKDEVLTTTTQTALTKTTKESYYQQQQQQQTKHLTADSKKDLKNFNVKISSDKQVSESKTQTKQVSLLNKKLPSNIESLAKQHAAKQVAYQQRRVTNSNSSLNNDKQYNYSFNLFLGSTTPRPAKSGLPTITPFPRRLRR